MATSMNEAEYVGVHHITKAAARESFVQHGFPAQQRAVPIPWSHLRLLPTGRGALYQSARAAVRVLVKAVWLFPILLIPKLVLRVMHIWVGDLITVGFVILVVVTFGSLSLLTLLHLLAGSRSQREAHALLNLDLPGAHALSDAATKLQLPQVGLATARDLAQMAYVGADMGAKVVHLRGTVDAGLARGAPVLAERWLEVDNGILRVVAGSSFALEVEGGPPVVVELVGSPTILAAYHEDAIDGMPPTAHWPGLAKPWLEPGSSPPPLQSAPTCIVRQGDVVELWAQLSSAIEDIREIRIGGREPRFVQAEGGPYRGEPTKGLWLRSLPDAPAVIAL